MDVIKSPHMNFSCQKCGRSWSRLPIQSRETSNILRRHFLSLCTKRGEATWKEMQRQWQ